MLAEFHVVPIGTGESMSEQIVHLLKMVDESGLVYKATAMGTIIEGEWDDVMSLIKRCHQHLANQWPRVLTSIHIDDRPGLSNRIEHKVSILEEKLGHELKK